MGEARRERDRKDRLYWHTQDDTQLKAQQDLEWTRMEQEHTLARERHEWKEARAMKSELKKIACNMATWKDNDRPESYSQKFVEEQRLPQASRNSLVNGLKGEKKILGKHAPDFQMSAYGPTYISIHDNGWL